METIRGSDLKPLLLARFGQVLRSKTLNAPILKSFGKYMNIFVELWFKNAFCQKSWSSALNDELSYSSTPKVTFVPELLTDTNNGKPETRPN